MNIFADEQDDDALLDSRCNSTTIVFGRRKLYPKSQQLLFICTWETCSYLPHAGLYSTSQPNNDIMPTTVWSAACSDETSMPWPNIFLPSTQTCLFSSAHPTPHKKRQKTQKKKKKGRGSDFGLMCDTVWPAEGHISQSFAILKQSWTNAQY